ncbi:DUF6603 domain-containing protein [Chitinophaga barathri]|uniref:DUF6603 domain-containing protein n=1 Tax=Chitinophaga barathri TaxID=1647451 RepID=A0A3N4ML54_9BACT|nr:DUF6603 domain-containing protein [Chitinophaga barathri]RPD42786.1 hypothetical protein EG028_00360 [Chitinophaga barathri]
MQLITPMTSLAEVKTWLNAQTPGTTVNVSNDMFRAALVNKLFGFLPETVIAVNNATIDVQTATATLSGTGTIIGQANTAITFVFTQPATALLAGLRLDLDASVQWTLIQSFSLAFTNLKATFTPDESLQVIAMSFTSDIQSGSNTNINIPVNISVASFEGDWTLSGSFTSIGNLTAELIDDIAGNTAITSILPSELAIISNFRLNGFQMAFNPVAQSCSFIRVVIEYAADWKFFNDKFIVDGIFLDFEITEPLSVNKSFHALLYANMTLGGTKFQVGGQFPDKSVYANLLPDSSLNVNSVFQFFHIPLPENFPQVDISLLGFVFYTSSNAFNFKLGITKPIPIAANVSFDSFYFEIGAANNPNTGALSPFGSVKGQFTIQTTTLLMSAAYNSATGLDIRGEVDNLPIGAILADLASKFGVTEIPAFIAKIMLDKLVLTYNTSSGNFTFYCKGSLPMAENTLTIEVSLTAIKTGATFRKDIEAKGIVTYNDQVFTLIFDSTSTDVTFSAEWEDKGKPIGFGDIAGLLGLGNDIPAIPEGLDLGLKSLKFTYNYTKNEFVMNSASNLFGNTVFVATKNILQTKWLFFFGLSTGAKIDLSNLPVIDSILPASATLAIEGIQVDIASQALDKAAGDAINKLIDAYSPPGITYPKVPEGGMQQAVDFSMVLNIGGTRIPLGLGAASNTPPRALATTPGGTTLWYNLQKSFGPLYFDKIGLSYMDSHIYVVANISATAGGLTIALNGIGISLPITDFAVKFTLSGVGITYSGGPVTISGALQGTFKPVNLTGLVLIKVQVLTISGIGGYTTVNDKPSMFLYAVINYPIGGPAFFFITGLSAGFGYNRSLVIPDINGVATFPFVQFAMGTGNVQVPNPQGNIAEQVNSVLQTLIDKGTVAPAVGTNWLAAGIRFTSFEIIDSFALLNVIIGTTVEIDLLGLSRLIIPPGAGIPGSPVPIVARAELALKASYTSGTGLVAIQGQLTTNSYVLSPSCHLTGGFAFYFWFAGDHAGDFVITLGGYNNAFTKPNYYPTVPRLGINWQVDSNLSVKGGEYFALTSNAVMAGGYLEAMWQSGSISAWFSLQADFLIMWKPFYYDISASVDIGASFTIKVWFIHKKITIHVGVSLHIWGPDFSGTAKIHVAIISFTISFGAKGRTVPPALTWGQFTQEMLPQEKGAAPRVYTSKGMATTPAPDVCKLMISNGLVTTLSDKDGELNWIVNPEKFELTATALIPSKTWAFSGNITLGPAQPPEQQNTDFGVRPVNVKSADFTSEQTITITSIETSVFHATKVLQNVSKAMWDQINFNGPGGKPAIGDPLNGTTLKNVLTGFVISPFVKTPHDTLPILLKWLQYGVDPEKPRWDWSRPYIATKSDFKDDTVPGTIMDKTAKANRTALLKAVNRNHLNVKETVDVDGLAEAATDYLLADPLMQLLGEEKI